MNAQTTVIADPLRERLAASVGGERRFADSFSHRTMRDLDARARRELDGAAEQLRDLLQRVGAALEREGLADFRQGDDEALAARYIRFWAAWQHAGARVANWMVTGPANFPVHTNNKRLATEDRRFSELSAFVAQAPAREVKRAKKARARALGQGGLALAERDDLAARLDQRRRRQELMRTINATIRQHKLTEDGDGPARLAALAAEAGHTIGEATARALLTPDWSGRRGFAAYQLSNNLAEIKRLEGRERQVAHKVERIEAAEADPDADPVRTVGEVQIRENRAEDRLQVIFPGKPDAETRAVLKRQGFRWSPRNGAWQRQLTNNARYAAQVVERHLTTA